MIYDWLANQECLFPWKPSIRVRREKISNAHTEDRRTGDSLYIDQLILKKANDMVSQPWIINCQKM